VISEPLAVQTRLSTFRRPGLAMAVTGTVAALVVGSAASLGALAGVGALVAATAALVVTQRPDLGAYALILLAPILSGLRRGLPFPALRLSEVMIAGLATVILVSATHARARRWQAFDWLALAYAAATLVLGLSQLLVRDEQLAPELVGTLLSPLQYLLLYRAVRVALPEPQQYRLALRLILLGSIPVSLSAVLQYVNVGGVRGFLPELTGTDVVRDYPDLDRFRATGTFAHWQVLGGYEFLIVVLGAATLLEGRPVMRRPLGAAVLGLAVAALCTTVTMSVILGAAAGALALGVWWRRMDLVVPALAVGGALAVLVFGGAFERRIDQQFGDEGRDRPAWVPLTMEYRYRIWRDQYVPVMSGSRYFTGYGPDDPPNLVFSYTESLYVTLVLRGGIPLLLIYAGLCLALLAAAIRARDDPEPAFRIGARVTAVALVLLVPMHWVEPYFIFTGMGTLLWIVAALAMNGRAASEATPLQMAIARERALASA
jgi:hypothetical protein